MSKIYNILFMLVLAFTSTIFFLLNTTADRLNRQRFELKNVKAQVTQLKQTTATTKQVVNEVINNRFITVGAEGRVYARDDYQIYKQIKAYDRKKKPVIAWIMKNSTKCWRELANGIVSWTDDKPHWLLLIAIMQVESSFDPTAVSNKGAIGLGQIMFTPDLVKNGIIEKRRDLFSPYYNISAMSVIFEHKLKLAKGNIIDGICKYLGAKDKTYVRNVLNNYKELLDAYNGG